MSNVAHRYLVPGKTRRASDMHVVSGYPVWNLIGSWYAHDQSDDAVIAEYQLDPQEWAEAKAYYLAHKAVIDARLIVNQEPADAEIEPGLQTAEAFFAWAQRRQHA